MKTKAEAQKHLKDLESQMTKLVDRFLEAPSGTAGADPQSFSKRQRKLSLDIDRAQEEYEDAPEQLTE